MNILVIGGTRLMGTHLVKALLENKHKVTIASRGISPDDFGQSVERIHFDRSDEFSIQKNLESLHFDVVYDSLAYASNDIKRLLPYLHCQKYIVISSAAVYDAHMNTKEKDFNPHGYSFVWCNRDEFSYQETKRQVECALVQKYPEVKSIFVRFPFVIGKDDYTQRLKFYVEHIIKQQPMFIDNYEHPLAFITSQDAGEFLAYLSNVDYTGPINGANLGVLSIKDIADYIYNQTKLSIVLSIDGDTAPYNGLNSNRLSLDNAASLGFTFPSLKKRIYPLLDYYIKENKTLKNI